jgi:hypothetical protein
VRCWSADTPPISTIANQDWVGGAILEEVPMLDMKRREFIALVGGGGLLLAAKVKRRWPWTG